MQRALQAATAAMTALSLTAVAGDIRVEGQFISTVPNGTPPLEVSSTTGVPNLNADTVDGFHGSEFYTVTELASSGGAAVHFDNITDIPTSGAKEINQDCATGSGCFSGDSGGFPVKISEPGTYRLTSNLDISGVTNPELRVAIDVDSPNVNINLGGFAILGATTCTGSPVTSCLPTGSGAGIRSFFAGDNLTVSNGTIRGMGGDGIACGARCTVVGVRALENGADGIHVSARTSLIMNNLVHRNGDDGIDALGVIRGNSSEHNMDHGIFSQPGSSVIGNAANLNGGDGVRCASCLLLDNTIFNNVGFGATLSLGAAYGRNMIYENDAGAISGSGLQVDTNLCGTGTAC